ncbi:ABC transporter permease [Pseudothermotoga sp. U03pept]|uniref:ABC transporter permease n=1 Tax=Pseudothermotoga sp. U03pept TaxID=3447012 RepID=UPI003EFFE539
MKKKYEQLQDSAVIPIGSYWQLVRRRFLKHRLAFVGLVTLLLVAIFSLVGPFLVKTTYDEFDLTAIFAPPFSQHHLFGTDELGRDVLVRLMYGGRISLFVGFVSSLITTGIGLLIGLLSGYFGGIVDRLLMRFVDVMLSVPLFPVLLILTMVFGSGLTNTILVLSVFGWMGVSRLVRGVVLSLRESDYVMAARVLGTSRIKILFKHILPNVMPITIVSATLNLSYAILSESSLSYLGLGIQPPTPSWGNMLQRSMNYILSTGHSSVVPWWLVFFPGFMIFITVLSVNFLGDGLRDALDPKFVSET